MRIIYFHSEGDNNKLYCSTRFLQSFGTRTSNSHYHAVLQPYSYHTKLGQLKTQGLEHNQGQS